MIDWTLAQTMQLLDEVAVCDQCPHPVLSGRNGDLLVDHWDGHGSAVRAATETATRPAESHAAPFLGLEGGTGRQDGPGATEGGGA